MDTCSAVVQDNGYIGAYDRCTKEPGHETSEDQATAIHDSGRITWYDGDLNQKDANAPEPEEVAESVEVVEAEPEPAEG